MLAMLPTFQPEPKRFVAYLVNTGVHQGSIFGITLFLLYINDRTDSVICDTAVYADDITLYKLYVGSSIWSVTTIGTSFWTWIWSMGHCGLGLDWGRKWLVDFDAGKLDCFCLTGLITLVLLMWKWMSLLLRKNQLLRCLDWISSLNWIGALILLPLINLFFCSVTSILVNFLVGIKKIDTISINDKILKGLRRLQNYFPHNVVLGILKIFFLFEKKKFYSQAV